MSIESLKSGVYVYMDNLPVTGIVSLTADETVKEKEIREFFTDKPWKVIPYGKVYRIKIELLGKDLLYLGEKFNLRIERDSQVSVYKDCYIKSLNNSFTDGKLITKAEIISFERE